MEMSQSLSNRFRRQHGFTLMETMFAIIILSVGLLSLAGLMSKMSGSTETSRYMSLASMLASEKLEDLNRYPVADEALAITTGTSAGSLTSDSTATSAGGNLIAYYDQVLMSAGSGKVTESIRAENASGTTYTTIIHKPDGTITTATTAAVTESDSMVFKRRWLIEKDTPIAGVRRVTVKVSLITPVGPPVNFQMSMVRP